MASTSNTVPAENENQTSQQDKTFSVNQKLSVLEKYVREPNDEVEEQSSIKSKEQASDECHIEKNCLGEDEPSMTDIDDANLDHSLIYTADIIEGFDPNKKEEGGAKDECAQEKTKEDGNGDKDGEDRDGFTSSTDTDDGNHEEDEEEKKETLVINEEDEDLTEETEEEVQKKEEEEGINISKFTQIISQMVLPSGWTYFERQIGLCLTKIFHDSNDKSHVIVLILSQKGLMVNIRSRLLDKNHILFSNMKNGVFIPDLIQLLSAIDKCVVCQGVDPSFLKNNQFDREKVIMKFEYDQCCLLIPESENLNDLEKCQACLQYEKDKTPKIQITGLIHQDLDNLLNTFKKIEKGPINAFIKKYWSDITVLFLNSLNFGQYWSGRVVICKKIASTNRLLRRWKQVFSVENMKNMNISNILSVEEYADLNFENSLFLMDNSALKETTLQLSNEIRNIKKRLRKNQQFQVIYETIVQSCRLQKQKT